MFLCPMMGPSPRRRSILSTQSSCRMWWGISSNRSENLILLATRRTCGSGGTWCNGWRSPTCDYDSRTAMCLTFFDNSPTKVSNSPSLWIVFFMAMRGRKTCLQWLLVSIFISFIFFLSQQALDWWSMFATDDPNISQLISCVFNRGQQLTRLAGPFLGGLRQPSLVDCSRVCPAAWWMDRCCATDSSDCSQISLQPSRLKVIRSEALLSIKALDAMGSTNDGLEARLRWRWKTKPLRLQGVIR